MKYRFGWLIGWYTSAMLVAIPVSHLYTSRFRRCPKSSGGLYRGDVSETLGTCLIWSGRSSWAIWYLSLKNLPKNETVRAKKLFLGCELEGGLKKNSFTHILFISKTFNISFMSWDTDFGSMSPFPLLKLPIKVLSLGKRHFWSILGGCMMFFFRLLNDPHLGWKF